MAEEERVSYARPGDLVPRPDPTLLTTAALNTAIATLEDKLMLRIDGEVAALVARLDAMDKAQTIFQDDLKRVPNEVTKATEALRSLQDEKFHAIEIRFTERDTRMALAARDAAAAVESALSAAEKAVGKAEISTAKQIDQQGELIHSTTDALRVQIDDAKQRLTRLEGSLAGQSGQKQESHLTSSFVVSLIAVLVAAAALLSRFLVGH